jgi:hypothetical protein
MFESGGGDADASVDQTRKIHPFNRPAGNTYQDARSRASPSHSSLISSDDWQNFTSERPQKTFDQVRERRSDSDDITGRGEAEARIGFVNPPTRSVHETHATHQRSPELKQRPAEAWNQSSVESWNDKGSVDELDWPPTKALQNPIVLNRDQNSGDGSQEPPFEPLSSPFHPSSWNQTTSRSTRLQTIRPRAPSSASGSSLSGSNPELKRNLDAASAVMKEERESSIGSKSSSSRSTLSHEDLGAVAKQAWKLSKIQSQTRASRLQNSPLHQMLKEKRSRKYVVEKPSQAIPTEEVEEIEEAPLESPNWAARRNLKSSDLSSSNSELRLSARLYRAEKYASIVRHNREPRYSGDDISIENSQQIEDSKGNIHPVFGYSASQTHATREKDVHDDATLTENYDSASGSHPAGNDLDTTNSKAEEATTFASTSRSRGKISRSERARQLKAVLSKSKGLQSNKPTTVVAVSDESSHESVVVLTSSRDEGHLDRHNDNLATTDNTLNDFESDLHHVRNPNSDQPRYDSTLTSVSDVDNSVLDGEGIAQISSGDESALNWSITTGSVSATTPFAQLNTSSNEGSGRLSSKASSGGSVTQRLAPIPDDDPRDHSFFSYTESQTSSGKEFQADKSLTDTSSSGTKPDALRWWQKKYGKKMSGSTNSVVRNAISKLSPKGIPLQNNGFFKIEDHNDEDYDDEDEDDVFFGLEDDDRFPTEEPLEFDGEAQEPFSLEEDGDIGIPAPLEFDGEVQEPFSSEEDGDIGMPAPTDEKRDTGVDENESKGEAARVSSPPPQASHSAQAPLEPSKRQGVYGHSGMMVSEGIAGRSVTSDMTSSIIKVRKSPYRPDVVETIREESVEENKKGFGVESTEEDDDDKSIDDGEEMDETTVGSATNTNVGSTIYSQPPPPPPPLLPPGHVLLNIGCAIVDTFSNACQVPGKPAKCKSCKSSRIVTHPPLVFQTRLMFQNQSPNVRRKRGTLVRSNRMILERATRQLATSRNMMRLLTAPSRNTILRQNQVRRLAPSSLRRNVKSGANGTSVIRCPLREAHRAIIRT